MAGGRQAALASCMRHLRVSGAQLQARTIEVWLEMVLTVTHG